MNRFQKIRKGDRKELAQAITLIESNLEKDEKKSRKLILKCLNYSGSSIRIGITGPPGVGKSTFIEEFGLLLNKLGKKVAVLAIDPTSQKSQGSILGDKTRMVELANTKDTFIRPSPTHNILGGIGRKTRESIILCEAAGFDVIIVETVGVGQSEISVAHIVDFYLLLILTGSGDDLQAIKRGVIEFADALIITKADGDNISKAKELSIQYQNNLILEKENGWKTQVGICSALEKKGLKTIWKLILDHNNKMLNNGFLLKNRREQDFNFLNKLIREEFGRKIYSKLENTKSIQNFREEILKGTRNSYQIIEELTKKDL